MTTVLPLRGLWRAGLLAAWDFHALESAGVKDLGDLVPWSRAELLQVPGLDHSAVARVEALLARHGMKLSPCRRPRFRRRVF